MGDNCIKILDFIRLYNDNPEFVSYLVEVFGEDGWHVVNPPGDGKCLLYALALVLIRDPEGHVLYQMMSLFIKGIKILTKKNGPVFIDTGDLNADNYEMIEFSELDDDNIIISKYITLTSGHTISNNIVQVFAHACNINIVIAMFDFQSIQPFHIEIVRVPPTFDDVDGEKVQSTPRYGFISTAFAHNFALLYNDYKLAEDAFKHCEVLEIKQQYS
jgi:hypothetical protein